MVLGIADDGDADAEAGGHGAFGDGVGGVVGAFGVDVGTQIFEKLFDVGFGKNHDEVDVAESGYEQGAGLLVEDGAAGAFEGANAGIGVDGDNEEVAFGFCGGKIADVADVERIEDAVGEDDALATLPCCRQEGDQFFSRDDFFVGLAHRSGGFAEGGRADGFEELGAGDGGGTAFHDDEAAGDVGEMRGFEGRSAGGEAEGVGGEDGVACAGDVDGLIAAVDGDVDGLHAGLEEGEAVAAAGDDEGFEVHLGDGGAAAAFEFGKILADGGVVEGFDFTFVGCGGMDAGALVVGEAVARVEGGKERAFIGGKNFAKFPRVGDTETVVGNGQGVCFFERLRESGVNFILEFGGQGLAGFVVHAEDLLADFVGPAGEESGFGRSGPAIDAENAGDVDLLVAEKFEETVAGFVFADGGDGNDLGAEGGEIVGGVGAAAGDDLGFTMLENEDGGFAGDTSDVAELKCVGDEIAEDDDGFGGEALDDFGERQEVHGGSGSELFLGALGHLSLRIQSTAVSRFSVIKSGCLGQVFECQVKSPRP